MIRERNVEGSRYPEQSSTLQKALRKAGRFYERPINLRKTDSHTGDSPVASLSQWMIGNRIQLTCMGNRASRCPHNYSSTHLSLSEWS